LLLLGLELQSAYKLNHYVQVDQAELLAKHYDEIDDQTTLYGMRAVGDGILDNGEGKAVMHFIKGETATDQADARSKLDARLATWQQQFPRKDILSVTPVQGYV
jgi:hypothetical protein